MKKVFLSLAMIAALTVVSCKKTDDKPADDATPVEETTTPPAEEVTPATADTTAAKAADTTAAKPATTTPAATPAK
jgi:hypothetical protein